MYSLINTICLTIFSTLYQIIHTHLTSYIIIAGISLYILKLLWKKLNQQKKSRDILAKIVIITGLIATLTFTIWFICFHFHTFRLLG